MAIKQFQAQWDSNDSDDYRAWLNALMSRSAPTGHYNIRGAQGFPADRGH